MPLRLAPLRVFVLASGRAADIGRSRRKPGLQKQDSGFLPCVCVCVCVYVSSVCVNWVLEPVESALLQPSLSASMSDAVLA